MRVGLARRSRSGGGSNENHDANALRRVAQGSARSRERQSRVSWMSLMPPRPDTRSAQTDCNQVSSSSATRDRSRRHRSVPALRRPTNISRAHDASELIVGRRCLKAIGQRIRRRARAPRVAPCRLMHAFEGRDGTRNRLATRPCPQLLERAGNLRCRSVCGRCGGRPVWLGGPLPGRLTWVRPRTCDDVALPPVSTSPRKPDTGSAVFVPQPRPGPKSTDQTAR